ncbi:aspartyl-phosphate phosphatase Spo0E family protein [Ammoniphilus resinae]|uniref:aspartyl-phosphate phosphatase Spo0E family protein n=1 Tax=Ammoniphilus resinae TaxID=861532 RepID=UPI001AE6BA93|nr:aspartyl-phosphate phosphatase Spo0E family protein [Ammoniphilus resinae]
MFITVKEEGVTVISELNIECEIQRLKEQLELTAKENNYNFQHPQVIDLSQKLDKLITLVMRNRWHNT